MAEKAAKEQAKSKKIPIPKWRTKTQIFVYAIVSIVLLILGTHGFIMLDTRKTIMIFGDQDNFNHNLTFASTYFVLGVIGVVCSFFDFKLYQERKKNGLFKEEPQIEA